MATDKETIELILEAKDLSGDKLKNAAKNVKALGNEAKKTEQELDQLKIDNDNLQKFVQLGKVVKELEKSVIKTASSNKTYAESLKSVTKVSKKQNDQLEKNKIAYANQKRALNSASKEYDKISNTLKDAGVNSRTYNVTLKKQQDQIRKLSLELKKLNTVYDDESQSLLKTFSAQEKASQARKKEIELAKLQADVLEEISILHDEAIAEDERRTASINEQILSQKKLTESLEKESREKIKLLNINERLNDNAKEEKRRSAELNSLSKKREASLKKLNKAHVDAIVINNELDRSTKSRIANEKLARVEAEKLKVSTDKYRIGLEKLNNELEKGKITKSKYIKSDQKLRRSLNLTEKQARKTAKAIASTNSSKAKKSTDSLTKATRRLAQAYTVVIAAQQAASAVASTVKGYSELESAIVKVQKTTDLTKGALESMVDELQTMGSEVTPTATNELLRFAEIAGQLGAESSSEILQVVTAADALGASTNLAGDEAVTLLTRMLKMTGEGIPAIGNLSSSLVDLGNNFAANEAEIAQMTKEIIVGTTAINLSSAASAGYAATLKELGQTGERSRTTFSRLSGVLQKAGIEGGDALKELASITRLTGDEIRDSLGKDSEVVLSAFVNGLSRVRSEGGSVRTELKKFGLTAETTVQVLGTLAKNSDRLAEGVKRSADAYVAGNAHLIEAAKAYATQESSLGRLNNKFIEIKASIGEAFSDETANTIDRISQSMKDSENTILELANGVADLVDDVVGLADSLEGVLSSLGVFEGLSKNFQAFRIIVNEVSAGFDILAASVLQVRIYFAEFFGSTEEELDKLYLAQDKAFKSMEENLKDVADATDILLDKSSSTYQDLEKAAIKYKDSIELLEPIEQKRLETALKAVDLSAEGTKEQIKLTAALVKAGEANKIILAQEKKLAEAKKISIENSEIERRINIDLQLSKNALVDLEDKYNKQLQDGLITRERFNEILKIGQKVYDETLATLKPFIPALLDLDDATIKASKSTRSLVLSIRDQQESIAKLNIKLKKHSSDTDEYKKVLYDLAEQTRTLALDETKLAEIRELENKKLSELVIISKAHNLVLGKLKFQYENSIITREEFLKQTELLKTKTDFLSQALSENTDSVEANVTAYSALIKAQEESDAALQERLALMRESTDLENESAEAKESSANSSRSNTQAVSAYLQVQNDLNKELDFTNLTIEELVSKSDELNSKLLTISNTTSGFNDDLSRLNNASIKRQQGIIDETIQLKKLEDEVKSGSLSMRQLDQAANSAVFSFRLLGDEQLKPLREAIRSAKSEFQDLSDTINDSFLEVEDRLDAILGNNEDIVKRRFKRELDDLVALLDQARDSGDTALINKINSAIRNLKQAQKLEFQDQFNSTNNNSQPPITPNSASTTVVVNFVSNGVTTALEFANQSSADDFVSQMEALQEINSNGIG